MLRAPDDKLKVLAKWKWFLGDIHCWFVCTVLFFGGHKLILDSKATYTCSQLSVFYGLGGSGGGSWVREGLDKKNWY